MTKRRIAFGCREVWQVFPEELAAIDHLSATHVEQIHGQHPVLIVITEDVGIVPFGSSNPLTFLQLLDRGNQIAIARRPFVLLAGSGLFHTAAKRSRQIGWPALKKHLHVVDRFLVTLPGSEFLRAGSKAAFDVVLQARTRM